MNNKFLKIIVYYFYDIWLEIYVTIKQLCLSLFKVANSIISEQCVCRGVDI